MVSPNIRNYLNELAIKLDKTEFGSRSTIMNEAKEFLGVSKQTIYPTIKRILWLVK